MKHAAVVMVVGLSTALAVSVVEADSIFSGFGYGRLLHPVDARAAGMGDVSLVSSSAWSFSPRNPSLMAGLPDAAAYLSFNADFTQVDAGAGRETRPDGGLPFVAVGLPISRVTLALSLFEMTDARHSFVQRIEGDPTAYDLISEGSGAWSRIQAAVAGSVGRSLSVGASVGIPFSSIEDHVTRDFHTTGYVDRDERSRTSLEDVSFLALGAQYRVGALTFGGFGELPTSGEISTVVELIGDTETRTTYDISLPGAFGVAGSFLVSPTLAVSGEFRRQPWSDVEIDDVPWEESDLDIARAYEDVDAWGVGLEWRRGARSESIRVRDHIQYRLGYAFTPWMTAGPNGGRVTDRSLTTGIGIPFARDNGELNVALRYTQRREAGSDLRENVVSVTFGVSFARQPRDY